MIALLTGIIQEKSAGRLVLDVGGVGYEVWISFSSYCELDEEGSRVTLEIYTHVKEDQLKLYGFTTKQEKELFVLLIQISGIGPKLGVTILSGLLADDLALAVRDSDLARLTGIPGVGKRTGERILLELSGKLDKVLPDAAGSDKTTSGNPLRGDVVSALVNLGYTRNAAERTMKQLDSEGSSFQDLLRSALKELSG